MKKNKWIIREVRGVILKEKKRYFHNPNYFRLEFQGLINPN